MNGSCLVRQHQVHLQRRAAADGGLPLSALPEAERHVVFRDRCRAKGQPQDRGPDAQDLRRCRRERTAGAATVLREMRFTDRVPRRGHARPGVHQSGHPGEHLLAQSDDGGLVRDGTALDRHRRDETARRAQSAAGGLAAAATLSQNPLSRRPRWRTHAGQPHSWTSFTSIPRSWSRTPRKPAGSPRWARRAPMSMRGRPEAWREVYGRLRAVASDEDAIEAIDDLRELLEFEDLLMLPALPLEQRHRSPR